MTMEKSRLKYASFTEGNRVKEKIQIGVKVVQRN
jgi:hypothetical protein